MKTIYKILPLLLAAFVISCTEEVSVDIPHKPQYIVFGSVSNISKPISVSVFKSVPVNSDEKSLPVNNVSVAVFSQKGDDAPVLLTDNFTVENGIYTSAEAIAGLIGTSYWVEISLDDGSKLTSEKELMKEVVPISTVNYESLYQVKVTFPDPADERNYYLLESEFINKGKLYNRAFAVSDDVIFNGNANAAVELDIFYRPNGDEELLKVALSNINYSSYQFHLNRWKQKEDNENNSSDTDNNGSPGSMFSTPPVNLQGNMKSNMDDQKVLGNFTVNAFHVEEI